MKESFWAILVVMVGIVSISFVFFFQSVTNVNEHNYILLKEINDAAMMDSFDLAWYRVNKVIRIDREKYVESFIRRFADSASLSSTYRIEIMDINEMPPKVSVRISSLERTAITGDLFEFDVVNTLDSIIETTY